MRNNIKLLDWYAKENLKEFIKRNEGNRYRTPHAISILVTNRCSLKCKHCFYHKIANTNVNQEMTFDEYEKLSNNLEPFFYGLFCGGEPFIRKDFAEIINLFRTNNKLFWTGVTTNGQLQESIVEQVNKICMLSERMITINVSLEGMKDFNDEIRGKGTFEKAIQTWKELLQLRKIYPHLKLGLSTTMTAFNQEHLMDFFSWFIKNMHPDAINLLLVRQDPRAGEEMKQVDLEKYYKTYKFIKREVDSGTYGGNGILLGQQNLVANELVYKTMKTGEKQFKCYAGVHGAFIDYNGDVNVCEVMPDAKAAKGKAMKMGNLRDYDMDFLKLWNSSEANEIRNCVNNHVACKNCTHETEGYVPSLVVKPNELSNYLYN